MGVEEVCLPDLLREQARETPNAMALVCGREQFSYRGLDHATDSLCAFLRLLGISLDDRVGIFMQPCSEYVVASIGNLKAGAAFMHLALQSPDNL